MMGVAFGLVFGSMETSVGRGKVEHSFNAVQARAALRASNFATRLWHMKDVDETIAPVVNSARWWSK